MDHLATTTLASTNEALHDLFALSDDQILEIEPEKEGANGESRLGRQESSTAAAKQVPTRPGDVTQTGTAKAPSSASRESPSTSHDAPEPPSWLAAQMKDPWAGSEARELWDGVQQARSEAAAYRAAI